MGTLLGLACGDALGRPVEFQSAERITAAHGRVTEMLGYGTHDQPAGTVTDDTDLALCIARSLADCGTFDGADVAHRFVEWYEAGPFDVGGMTAAALTTLRDGTPWQEAGLRVWSDRAEGNNAGNGSVMRCAPYAIRYADDPDELVRVSRLSSAITHADPRCTDGCAVLNHTLVGLARGDDDPLGGALAHVDAHPALRDALDPLPAPTDPSLVASGYVVDTLRTALAIALRADDAESAIVDAVGMGDDTDTVGAVTGALVGARFGAEALPERWLADLDGREEIAELARTLSAAA